MSSTATQPTILGLEQLENLSGQQLFDMTQSDGFLVPTGTLDGQHKRAMEDDVEPVLTVIGLIQEHDRTLMQDVSVEIKEANMFDLDAKSREALTGCALVAFFRKRADY